MTEQVQIAIIASSSAIGGALVASLGNALVQYVLAKQDRLERSRTLKVEQLRQLLSQASEVPGRLLHVDSDFNEGVAKIIEIALVGASLSSQPRASKITSRLAEINDVVAKIQRDITGTDRTNAAFQITEVQLNQPARFNMFVHEARMIYTKYLEEVVQELAGELGQVIQDKK